MSPEDYQKVKSLFNSALELNEEEREKFLTENCADNSDLRRVVERLLASHENSSDFIESPAIALVSDNLLEDKINSSKNLRLGNYKIEREIGRGGMGSVYLATRSDDQFNKRVAIKILRRGMDTEDILRRFRNERRILAALDHPNIARLLDAGTTDDGLPYFVMEYVEGEAIDKYCDEHKLDTRERLQLFRKVCSAVQYAHQNLIVHRDLKPSNIIVTESGEPKLLDFGIAKLLNPELTSHTIAPTATFVRLMTPDYASPEQIRGKNITTASDIYSLGILLYKLLTGQQPYNFQDSSPQEIERVICESQPTKPSEVFKVRSAEGGKRNEKETPHPALRTPHSLRGDLDNIVLMALRKEPERRYRSVEHFSQDIERHLKGLPVAARPNTFAYRTEKFIRRNKVGVIAASLIVLAFLVGLVATVWQARVAARERDQAKREKAKAEQLNNFLQTILSSASPEEKGKDAKVIEVLDDAAHRVQTEFANQPELKAQALLTIGKTYNDLGLIDQAEKILREALKINTELYGENNKAAAMCMRQLGEALSNKAKYDEAKNLFSKAIDIERGLSPEGSKELAVAIFCLGEVHIRKREFEMALPLLKESISISNKLSGENNEDSAYTLVSLGRAQERLGDLAAAESNYRQSIAIYRQLPSRYEGRLAAALLNLGNLLTTKGNHDEAVNAMSEGDSIFQKQGESYNLFISKSYLCKAFFSKGDYEKTIEVGQKAISMGHKFELTETLDFVLALNNIGLSLTRTGKAKEGEPHLRQSFDGAKKVFPQTDFRIPLMEGALGECLTAQNKFAEAEPFIVKSYETLKVVAGEKSPQLALARKRAIDLYEKWNKPDIANKYRAIVSQIQK